MINNLPTEDRWADLKAEIEEAIKKAEKNGRQRVAFGVVRLDLGVAKEIVRALDLEVHGKPTNGRKEGIR